MRTLLIDADVVAYNAAFACETAVEFEPGYWTWHVGFDEVVSAFDAEVSRMVETLKADDFKLCLTDSAGNFRHALHPDYKSSRKSVRKPIVLKAFKEFLAQERGAYFKPGLEGDDCMGILATHPTLIPGEKIIVSSDKDMKTIPGRFCRWGVDKQIVMVPPARADYWHMFQTLTGDVTDGYRGLPGCGPAKAEKILTGCDDASEGWKAVVAAYEKAGFTADDALTQARMARILRASDYDFKRKEPILWTPPV